MEEHARGIRGGGSEISGLLFVFKGLCMCFIDLNKNGPPLMSGFEKNVKISNPNTSKRFTEVFNINPVYLSLLEKKKKKVYLWDWLWLSHVEPSRNNSVLNFVFISRGALTSSMEMTAQYFCYVSNARWILGYSNNDQVQQFMWSNYETGVDLCFLMWYFVESGS